MTVFRMMELNVSASLESALNDRYRGHSDRNWTEWSDSHSYCDADSIPTDASKALIGRQKLNYRGISKHRSLRHLISGNVDQSFLQEICELAELERLELEWPMVAKDLSPLIRLKKLTFLSIDSPRNIADFSLLLNLPSLRTLIITNPKKMTDLEWLSEAHHLEVIGIEGGTWSPYNVPTLKPLAGLRSLKAFLGVSIKVADQSLAPFVHCPTLEYLGIACVAPKAEFDDLKKARPKLICNWFRDEMWTP
ncbi:MAG: hypothetical protein EOP09_13730 [Proteobacteria bacterium]|nr:MAG: hypothetical protein EOP09_13730 [Pseudomonadota bacterium]